MLAAATLIQADSWKADVSESAGVAYRVTAAVRQGHHWYRIYSGFRRVTSLLQSLTAGFDAAVRETQDVVPSPENPAATRDAVEAAIGRLWDVQIACDTLYTISVNKGLRKKALLRRYVEAIGDARERVLDIIDWLRLCLDDEAMAEARASFTEGLAEYQRGETVALP